jgi:hypothetical protein
MATAGCYLIGIDAGALLVGMGIVILIIAAPRRAKDLGADEMRDSRPGD